MNKKGITLRCRHLRWFACVAAFICCLSVDITVATEPLGSGKCGAYSLNYLCSMFGVNIGLKDLEEQLGINGPEGTTFHKIVEVGENLGFDIDAVKITSGELIRQNKPAIAFVKGNHFVVIAGYDGESRKIFVLDYPNVPQWVHIDYFSKIWRGETLLFERKGVVDSEYGPLWIPEGTIDLGIFEGISQEVSNFTAINSGNSPLTVKALQFSCPCAKVVSPKLPFKFEAGQVKQFILDVDTSEKSKGEFSIKALFHLSGSSKNRQVFPVKGTVHFPYHATPGFFGLSDISAYTRRKTLRTKIYYGKGKEKEPVPDSLGPGVEWKGWKPLGDGVVQVEFDLKIDDLELRKDRRFRTGLVIGTNNDQDKAILIYVAGRVSPPVEVYPKTVFLDRVLRNEKIERRIALYAKELQFENNLEEVKVDVLAGEAPLHAEDTMTVDVSKWSKPYLTLSITAPDKLGLFNCDVEIMLGDRKVVVPVVGICVENKDGV